LGAKLASFKEANPQIQYHIVADENADFTEANLDLAVRLVDGPGELEGAQLAEAQRVVVAAPNAQDSWISWPGAPLPEGAKPCVTTGNPGQALSLAISGLGKAVLPFPLVEEGVAAGRLEILEGPDEGRRAYWLVAPLPQWRQKKVKALVAFLTGK